MVIMNAKMMRVFFIFFSLSVINLYFEFTASALKPA